MSSTVLVTGANGFVGSHLVSFLRPTRPTIGLVRAGRGGSVGAGSQRELTEWTVGALGHALEGVDVVVHAASVVHRPGASLSEYESFNTEGTRALVQACRDQGVKQLVLLSTIKVYGENPPAEIDESTPVQPDSGYSTSKISAERIVEDATQRGWLSGAVLRLCPVFGPGDKGNVRTMIRAIARRRFLLPGDGATRKSIVHVSTVAEVVAGVVDRDVTGKFIVADREAPSMRALAHTIANGLGKRVPVSMPVPAIKALAWGFDLAATVLRRPMPVSRALIRKSLAPTVCRPNKIEAALQLQCHVDLASAIDQEIAWMRATGLL